MGRGRRAMSGVAPRRGTRTNPGPWIEIHGYLQDTAPRCGRDSRSSFFQPSVETLGYFLSPYRAGVGATGWERGPPDGTGEFWAGAGLQRCRAYGANDTIERRGRPVASALATDAARPR